jgi:hypothetical protein
MGRHVPLLWYFVTSMEEELNLGFTFTISLVIVREHLESIINIFLF